MQTIGAPKLPAVIGGYVVALDDRGTAYATWTGAGVRISGVQLAARGRHGPWGTVRRIGSGSNPVIAATPDGSAIVGWHLADPDSEGGGTHYGPLMVATRLPNGAITAPQQVSPIQTHAYTLAVAGSGEVMLADSALAPGEQPSLSYAVRPPQGGPFGAARLVPGVQPGEYVGGQLAYLGDGTAIYVWDDTYRNSGLHSIARPAGGEFGDLQDIARDTDADSAPMLGAYGNTAVVAWTQLVTNSNSSYVSSDRP